MTIVEFESEEALREWRIHPEHTKAKRRGIEAFFSEYKYQICSGNKRASRHASYE